MRRSRRSYRRFGAAEDAGPLKVTPGSRFEIEPASRPAAAAASSGGKKQFLPFLTPKVGNTLVGVGAIAALGAVGYYVWKGGDLSNLWRELFGGTSGEDSGATYTSPQRPSVSWARTGLKQSEMTAFNRPTAAFVRPGGAGTDAMPGEGRMY